MRTVMTLLIVSAWACAQTATPSNPPGSSPPAAETSGTASAATTGELTVPAGTKVPVALKHAISTKSAHEGDAVYAETTFPVALDNRILIPAGTYVQGKISHVEKAGRIKGTAEVLIHFTTLIYPNGYTVLLP